MQFLESASHLGTRDSSFDEADRGMCAIAISKGTSTTQDSCNRKAVGHDRTGKSDSVSRRNPPIGNGQGWPALASAVVLRRLFLVVDHHVGPELGRRNHCSSALGLAREAA